VVTSSLLTLIVIPAIYGWFEPPPSAIEEDPEDDPAAS
jgi:hypothetical protein